MTTGTGSDLRATTEADTRPLAYGQTSEVGDMSTYIISFSNGNRARVQATDENMARRCGYKVGPDYPIVDVRVV